MPREPGFIACWGSSLDLVLGYAFAIHKIFFTFMIEDQHAQGQHHQQSMITRGTTCNIAKVWTITRPHMK